MAELVLPRSLSKKRPLTEADDNSSLNTQFVAMTGEMTPAKEGEKKNTDRMSRLRELHQNSMPKEQAEAKFGGGSEPSERMKRLRAFHTGQQPPVPARSGGVFARAFDYAKDNLVAGVVATTNTVSKMVGAIPVGWMGLGKLAMGEDPDEVSQWMEKQYFSIHAKDPQAQALAQQSEHLIGEAFDKAIPAPFAYAYGKSAMNAGLMNEEQFKEHMATWGSLHGLSKEWAKTQGLEARPVKDESGNIVGWTQPEATYWQAFGSAVIQLGPWIILGESIGRGKAGPAELRASGKGHMAATDLAKLDDMLKDPQFAANTSTRSKAVHAGRGVKDLLAEAQAEVAAEREGAKAAAETGGEAVTEVAKSSEKWEIPDVTEGVDTPVSRPTPRIPGMEPVVEGPGQASFWEAPKTPDFSRPMPGEKPFTPTHKIAKRNVVEVTPKDPTPLPEATTLSEPTYIDARSGHEVGLYGDAPPSPMGIEVKTHRVAEPARAHTADGKTFFRQVDGSYVEQGVTDPKVTPKVFKDLNELRTGKTVEVTEGTAKATKKVKTKGTKSVKKGTKKRTKSIEVEPSELKPEAGEEVGKNPQGDEVIIAPTFERLKSERQRLGREEYQHRYNPLHQEALLIEKLMERGSSRADAKLLAREELRGYPTDYARLYSGGMWKILGDKLRNHLIEPAEAAKQAITTLKEKGLGEWEGDKLIVYHLTKESAAKNILKKGFDLSKREAAGPGISVSVNFKTATAMRRALDRMNRFKTHEAVDAWAIEHGANKAELSALAKEYYADIARRKKQLRDFDTRGVTGVEKEWARLAKKKQPGGYYLHVQSWLHKDMKGAGPYDHFLDLPKNEFLWNDMAMKLVGEKVRTVKSKLDLTKLGRDELASVGRLEYFLDRDYMGVEGEVRSPRADALEPTTFYTGKTYNTLGKGLKSIWDEVTKGKIENNASADNPASLEAIRRLMQQKDILVMRTNINNLKQFDPMIATVDRVDIAARPNELIIAKKIGDPRMIVLDAGPNLRRVQVQRAMQHLHNKSSKGSLFSDAASTMFSQAGWKFGADAIKDIGRRLKDSELLNKTEDYFYIEPRFQRLGAEDTGHHVKNANSYSAAIMKQSAKRLITEAERVGYDPTILQDAVIVSETPSLLKKYEGTQLGDFAQFMRDEFDNARVMLKQHGIDVNFKRRMQKTLTDKLSRAIELNDRGKVEQYRRALGKLDDFEFVSIPKNMWFEAMMQSPKTEGKALRILNSTKRNILRISDMAEFLGDKVNAMDVMAAYYQKMANDMALAKIIEAGLEDGMITVDRQVAAKLQFEQIAGAEAPAFAKYYMHPVLRKTLHNEFIRRVNPSIVNQATSLVKMLTFDSPWYLGYYDIHQAAIRRGWKDLPGILRDSWEGYQMIKENHPEVQLAQENGLTSTPYPQPFEVAMKSIQDMHRGLPKRIADIWHENLHPIKKFKEGKGKGIGRLPVLPEVYTVLWDTAWNMFDAPIRQGTYNYLRRQGMDVRSAAQTAALYHGDYAAVPRSTRVQLNKALYTPTFKIAMAKMHGRLIKEAITGKSNLKYGKVGRKAAISGIATILLTNAAFDLWLTEGMGFKRDSWGRRYSKDVETDRGIEQFTMTLSHPQNLGPKYVEKMVKAFATNEPGSLQRLFRSGKYEFTPLLVIAWDSIWNSSPEGQIYNTYDDDLVKVKKIVGHGIRSISSWANSAFPTEDTKRTQDVFTREVGAGIDILLGSISHQYLGKPKYKRQQRRMQNAKANFKRDLARMRERGEYNSENFQMILKNFLKDINQVWDD